MGGGYGMVQGAPLKRCFSARQWWWNIFISLSTQGAETGGSLSSRPAWPTGLKQAPVTVLLLSLNTL